MSAAPDAGVVVRERRWIGEPSAGILTPMMVTGGGTGSGGFGGEGFSCQPRKDRIRSNIVWSGRGIEVQGERVEDGFE